jgi:hypothetical protein
MTIFEMRIVSVLGLLAIGVVAILASLAMVHLQGLARRLNTRITRARSLPSLRGDAHEAARVIDHRQAAWRLRC